MTWRFSDGTTVHLGGEVEGSSLFAQELREKLADPETGVQIYPLPAAGVRLDRSDPAILNAWLRQMARQSPDEGVSVTEAPKDLPPLPPPPRSTRTEPLPPDAVH